MGTRSRIAALIGAIVLSAVGCGSHEDAPATPTPPTAPSKPSTPAPTHSDGYTLQDAAARGLIEYTLVGTGGSSGDTLMLHVRRLGDQEVVLYVDPGTVFGPSEAGFQRMVVAGVRGIVADPQSGGYFEIDTIRLDTPDLRVYVLEAYCMDFELENPTAAVSFAPLAYDPRAAAVIGAAKSSGLTMPATQAAIWLDRGHVTKEDIGAKFEASDQELEDAWQLLQRMPPP